MSALLPLCELAVLQQPALPRHCPAIVLAWEGGGEQHPVSVAEALEGALPGCTALHIASDLEPIHEWPELVEKFLLDRCTPGDNREPMVHSGPSESSMRASD